LFGAHLITCGKGLLNTCIALSETIRIAVGEEMSFKFESLSSYGFENTIEKVWTSVSVTFRMTTTCHDFFDDGVCAL